MGVNIMALEFKSGDSDVAGERSLIRDESRCEWTVPTGCHVRCYKCGEFVRVEPRRLWA
ncbi:hypothetical protein HanIR_Chr16g0836971 [Helianthus annuus]|nr:hypothetical protein HanIR_Chr16g0836971 [Helianthus annuus]